MTKKNRDNLHTGRGEAFAHPSKCFAPTDDRPPLPEGWVWTTIGESCYVERGITFPSSVKSDDKGENVIACLRTANVQEVVDWQDLLYVPRSYVKKEEKLLRQNDILISMANSVELVGKVSFVSKVEVESSFGAFIAAIRAFEHFVPKFLFYYLRTSEMMEIMRNASSQTVNIANLSLGRLNPLPVICAPLPEQQRIVEAIETQFTRLDAAVAALERAKANLARYKASVLKAACRGEAFAHPSECFAPTPTGDCEPADVLLARILDARRRRWMAGNPGKRYVEPQAPDTSNLPELPEGWCWASVDQVSWAVQYGASEKANLDPSGIPVLRMGNIQDGELDFENLKYLPSDYPQLDTFILEPDDVLFNRTNSAELVGKTAVYKSSHPKAVFASYLIRVRVLGGYSAIFLSSYINSVLGRQYIASVVSQQVGQANVNGTKLKNMPVPLPPLAEQRRIVAEVERRLSVVAEVEASIDANLARAARLRQAILKRAFEGRLV